MNHNILENKIINTQHNKKFSPNNTKNFKATQNGPFDINNIGVIEQKYETAKKENLSYWEQLKEKLVGKHKTLYQETNNINIVFENNKNKFGIRGDSVSGITTNPQRRTSFSKIQDAFKQNGFSGAVRIFTNKPISDMEYKTETPIKNSVIRSRQSSEKSTSSNTLPVRISFSKICKDLSNNNIARSRSSSERSTSSQTLMSRVSFSRALDANKIVDEIPTSSSSSTIKENSEILMKCSQKNNSKFSFITTNKKDNNPIIHNNNSNEELNAPIYHEEIQYMNLIREIINTGYNECGRNGDTLTKFGYSMRFSLRDGTIPILTTKKIAWRVCFEELFWFIRGATNNKELQKKNVHIWDQNSSREFLDSRGLYYLEEGDLGPIYGFQWRHFNTEYTDSNKCYQGEGVDQLEQIIETLKNPETRSSRRMIMTAWNPCQNNYMALPPCHILAQFNVRENKYLSCALYQRSGDVGLGVPFNIASYSLLTHILAKHCGLEADEFIHFLGNCHIYKEHIAHLKQQIKLEPKSFPKIEINMIHDSIDDYCLDDISWIKPYESHPAIKMIMKA